MGQTYAGAMSEFGSDRPINETATAIGADIIEGVGYAIHAKCTLVSAYTRFVAIRREIPVTGLAIWTYFQH